MVRQRHLISIVRPSPSSISPRTMRLMMSSDARLCECDSGLPLKGWEWAIMSPSIIWLCTNSDVLPMLNNINSSMMKLNIDLLSLRTITIFLRRCKDNEKYLNTKNSFFAQFWVAFGLWSINDKSGYWLACQIFQTPIHSINIPIQPVNNSIY